MEEEEEEEEGKRMVGLAVRSGICCLVFEARIRVQVRVLGLIQMPERQGGGDQYPQGGRGGGGLGLWMLIMELENGEIG